MSGTLSLLFLRKPKLPRVADLKHGNGTESMYTGVAKHEHKMVELRTRDGEVVAPKDGATRSQP